MAMMDAMAAVGAADLDVAMGVAPVIDPEETGDDSSMKACAEDESSDDDDALIPCEWSFVKDGRAPLWSAPHAKTFQLVQAQWWKAVFLDQPIHINPRGKWGSSYKYHLVHGPQKSQDGKVEMRIYHQSAANPKHIFPPVMVRTFAEVLVVMYDEWEVSDDGKKVVVVFTSAMSGEKLKTVVLQKERMNTASLMRVVGTEMVKTNQLSIHTKVKNGYGHSGTKLCPWCSSGKGSRNVQ